MVAPTPSSSVSRVIAVLGMHRSGTSALARVFNLLGVALGSNLMMPTADNERGYWEQQEINNIHIVLMKALGRDWCDLSELPAGWLHNSEIVEPVNRIREILKREFDHSPLWGVKDPRMCLLMPLWLDLFRNAGIDPAFALIVRNPMEVAHSIARRDGIAEARGLMIWLRYVLNSERYTRGQRRSIITYRQLLENWRSTIDRIGQELGVCWPNSPDVMAADIDAFLEPALRKHRVDDQSLLADARVPDVVRRAYAAFLAAAKGDDDALCPALDAIREELNPRTALSLPVLESLESDNRRLREMLDQDRLTSASQRGTLQTELHEVRERAKVLENQVADARQIMANIDAEKYALAQRVEQEHQLAQSQQNLFAGELEKLRQQEELLSTQLAQTQKLLEQAKEEVARAETEIRISRASTSEIRVRDVDALVPNKKLRRVLFVSHGHPAYRPGGAEIYAWETYQGFQGSEDYEPLFLAKGGESYAGGRLPHPGTHIASDEHDPNVYFLHPGPDNFDYFLGIVKAKAALIDDYPVFLRTHQPDVVHFQHTVFFGYDIIRQTRNILPDVPIIYTLHEYIPICNANGQMLRRNNHQLCTHASTRRCHECFPVHPPQDFFIREQFIKSHFALVNLFVAPSRFLMERYIQWGIPREKICYEENGRNLPPAIIIESEAPRPRNRFAFFGQLNPYKGIDLLLKAMKILEKQPFEEGMRPVLNMHGANLEIQQAEFVQLIHELLRDTEAHVTFHGAYKTARLPDLMANVDWVVVPSIWWENAPLVIQEAFHYGKPVICSDIGGMAEKVRDGIDGLHFQVSNAESLARVIHRAATTPGLWEALRRNIRPVHSVEVHVQHLSAMYDAFLYGSNRVETEAGDPAPSAIVAKVEN